MIKKLLFPALLGVMTMFAACEADPCKDLDGKCGTGTCFEGACVCEEGFEADAAGVCNLEWAAKFVGSYLGTDVSTSPTSPNNPDFNGTFELKATNPCKFSRVSETTVQILNLGGFESQFQATVKKASTSEESATVVEFTDAVDNSGSKWTGSLSYNATTKKLTGTYTLTFADNDKVNSTINYTQQ